MGIDRVFRPCCHHTRWIRAGLSHPKMPMFLWPWLSLLPQPEATLGPCIGLRCDPSQAHSALYSRAAPEPYGRCTAEDSPVSSTSGGLTILERPHDCAVEDWGSGARRWERPQNVGPLVLLIVRVHPMRWFPVVPPAALHLVMGRGCGLRAPRALP